MNVGTLFPLHSVSWMVAVRPVYSIIDAKDFATQETLTEKWKTATLSTLNSVIYIGAILSAVNVGAFSWSELESRDSGSAAIKMTQALWYPSLIFSVTSVCIGLCQTVFLARLGCTPNGNVILRQLLIEESSSGEQRPRTSQNLVWVLAVALLEWSMYLWLAGFLTFIWEVTRMRSALQTTGDIVVFTMCAVAFLGAVFAYVLSMVELWYRVWQNKKFLRRGKDLAQL